MIWLLGFAILLLIIFSEKFRSVAAAVLVLGAVITFVIWKNNEIEEKNSKKRISTGELQFEDTFLTKDFSSYKFESRITNKSTQYTLEDITIVFIFKDCKTEDNADCPIVAEEKMNIYVKIPPKQARDVEKLIYLNPEPKFNGRMIWSYSVVSTTGAYDDNAK